MGNFETRFNEEEDEETGGTWAGKGRCVIDDYNKCTFTGRSEFEDFENFDLEKESDFLKNEEKERNIMYAKVAQQTEKDDSDGKREELKDEDAALDSKDKAWSLKRVSAALKEFNEEVDEEVSAENPDAPREDLEVLENNTEIGE